MSPAVMDCRSSVNTAQPNPAPFQNPNPNSHISSHSSFDFSAFSSKKNLSDTMNSSSVENVSEGSFGNAFSSPAKSRTASAKPPPGSAAGMARSKPRLVKVRKQVGSQHGRSRTAPSEIDLGFNPFRSVSESSDRVSDVSNIGISTSNGFNAFVSDCKFKKFENPGFVFGANRSDSVADLDLGKGETSGSVDDSSSYDNGKMENKNESEYGKFDSMGFVFVAKRSDLELSLDSEKREFRNKSVDKSGSGDNGKMKNKNGSENGKFNDVGFVFSTNRSDLELNLDSGKREFNKSVDKLGSDDNGNVKIENESEYVKFDNVGFASGANRIDSRANLNPGKREPGGNAGKLGDTDNLGFVFGANQSDSVVNLNSEKREFSDSVGKLGSDDSIKTKIVTETECGKHENVGFLFGANLSDFASTSNSGKRESSENAGKSCSDDKGKMKIGIGLKYGKSDDKDFVFGASGSNLASNPNSEKREGFGNSRSLVSDNGGKIKVETETEFQSVKAAGVNFDIRERGSSSLDEDYEAGEFVFGSSSDQSSSFDEGTFTKLLDEMNKLKGENSGNCDGFVKIQNSNLGSGSGIKKNEYDNLGFDDNIKCSFAFGSSSNIASTFGISPVSELPDEMKKLNINDFGKVIGDDKSKDSNIKSCTDAEKIFVFRSGTKASCSSAGSLETTCDQMKNSNSRGSMSGDAVEKTGGVNCKTSDENNFISGSSYDINSASNGISSPKPYTFQAGLGTSSDVGQSPLGQSNDDTKSNGAAMLASFSLSGLSFQPNFGVFEASPLGRVERKDGFSFTSTADSVDASSMHFGQTKWDHSSFKANIFPGLNKKLEFCPKSRSVDKRSKKMGGKLRRPTLAKVCPVQDFAPRESSSQENLDSPGSPMDFSPYQETVEADQCPRETSVTSSESSLMDSNCAASTAGAAVSTDDKDEHLAAAGEGFDDNEGDTTCREPNEDGSRCYPEKGFVTDFPAEEFVSEAETAGSTSIAEQVCSSSGAGSGFSFDTERQENNSSTHFSFSSGLEGKGGRNFTFSASPSAQGSLSATKRQYRKKYRMKVGHDSFNIIPSSSSSVQFLPFASTSSHLDTAQGQKGEVSSFQSKGENKSEAVKELVEQESLSASAATKEVCEKWRLRGNQAYKNGDLSKAEDFYTWGINSVPTSETLECCLKPLLLCYSNRAATRMSLGRMREALGDCRMAAALDPNFLKVQMRAANCHLVLGEVEDALQLFAKCLESGTDVCLDRRIIIEASDGLQKAQKVAKCMNRCAELLQQRTSDAAISALELIAEALSISSYSEKLLEMKADALCMLRKYEEVIQLCEQTLDFAEKNFALVGAGHQLARANGHECKKNSFVRLWRLHLISKSYFHLGRLEVALDLLEKQEQVGSIIDKCESKTVESSIHLAITIRELLCHKNAGNEAFQAQRHAEALKHYSAALSSNVESRPFAAICFCNRAAAHQALGQIADAIADCSLAIALDGNYAKAVSRRATLHEMIRDYAQAASDLQRFISIFEKPSHKNAKQSGGSGGPVGSTKELRRAHRRLSSMEEQAKKEIPLDLYLILGIKPSDTASEIKKAYRKAALRHHPDKAGQFLARSESRDDGRLWKEIGEEVHKDADRLFKMIGEAYAVLSDPTKRSQYDLEEELRNAPKDRNNSNIFRRESDVRSSPFERSNNRRYWRESWNPYGNSHSRW